MNESQYKQVFFDVAHKYTCWIGLRDPNPLSIPWVGRAGYAPKPETCKAKSADKEGHKYAGLVVNPLSCAQAFTGRTLQLAVDTWNHKFAVGGRVPAPYKLDGDLVKLNNNAIHADFDLMAIVRSNSHGDFIHTPQMFQEELFRAIKPELNRGLGSPMIQHGAEFMWTGGLGARGSEWVLWFGPGRRFRQAMSSMPQEAPH